MSEATVILRKNKKLADGTHPLAIYIYKNDKETVLHIGYSLMQEQWDEEKKCVRKSHPNHTRLNNLIKKRLSEASDKKIQLETDTPGVSVQTIKQQLKPQKGKSFFKVAQSYLDDLVKRDKYNEYTADKPRIKHFSDFLNGQDIIFPELTVALLENFESYLKIEYKPKGKKKIHLADRSVVNHLVAIRSIFAYARKNGVADEKLSPFGKDKINIDFPEPIKIGLNYDEIKLLEDVHLDHPAYNHARNLWLIAYYFAGMRVSDVLRLKWSDFQDGRLSYKMGKNGKIGSLKITNQAAKILEQYKPYRQKRDDLVFDELKNVDLEDQFITKRTIAFKTSAIDKFLNKQIAPKLHIDKKLTMHIARHSFAQNASDIDVRTLQKLFRHTKLETTENYMGQFKHSKADDALDIVLSGSIAKSKL